MSILKPYSRHAEVSEALIRIYVPSVYKKLKCGQIQFRAPNVYAVVNRFFPLYFKNTLFQYGICLPEVNWEITKAISH